MAIPNQPDPVSCGLKNPYKFRLSRPLSRHSNRTANSPYPIHTPGILTTQPIHPIPSTDRAFSSRSQGGLKPVTFYSYID